MKPEVKYWVALGEEDLASARTLLRGEHYLNTLHHCHQALEKMLKALIQRGQVDPPPRTHDLLALAARARVWDSLPRESRDLLISVNPYGTQARYPASLEEPVKSVGQDLAEDALSRTGEVLAWLRQRLK